MLVGTLEGDELGSLVGVAEGYNEGVDVGDALGTGELGVVVG